MEKVLQRRIHQSILALPSELSERCLRDSDKVDEMTKRLQICTKAFYIPVLSCIYIDNDNDDTTTYNKHKINNNNNGNNNKDNDNNNNIVMMIGMIMKTYDNNKLIK